MSPHAASWDKALNAIHSSKGAIGIVSDEDILAAQLWLASNEGIFVEPASAASIAGLLKTLSPDAQAAYPAHRFPDGSKIVCVVTGHGLKNPDVAKDQCGSVIPAKAERGEILRLIQG